MITTRLVASILFILLSTYNSYANPLTAGNIAFEKNDFPKAFELYSEALSNGVKSFELYHNLGTVAAKLEKLDEARLYLEKALIIKPGNKETRKNIKWIKTELSENIAPLPEFLPSVYWKAISAILNVSTWYYSSFFFLLVAAFLLWQKLFNRRKGSTSKKLFALLILLLAFSLFSFQLGNSRAQQLSSKINGVVMKTTKQLKAEPEEQAEMIQALSAGAKVTILNELGEWSKVVVEDGSQGWIKNNGLAIIEL